MTTTKTTVEDATWLGITSPHKLNFQIMRAIAITHLPQED